MSLKTLSETVALHAKVAAVKGVMLFEKIRNTPDLEQRIVSAFAVVAAAAQAYEAVRGVIRPVLEDHDPKDRVDAVGQRDRAGTAARDEEKKHVG